MKKQIGLLFLLLVSVSLVSYVININAHSPSTVDLQYDLDTQTLDVTISHSVSDVNSHYIEEIRIWINDVSIQNETYTSQTSTTQHQDSFNIAATDGDVIKVLAICNVSGSLTDEITVATPAETTFNLVFAIVTLLVIGSVLGYNLHKKHTRK
jgi:hypothetical protein